MIVFLNTYSFLVLFFVYLSFFLVKLINKKFKKKRKEKKVAYPI